MNYKDLFLKAKERLIEEYLYYVMKNEMPQHIERRMFSFQQKVNRMMKRRGIALIAYKGKGGDMVLSYVPEKKWNEQKDITDQMLKQEEELNKQELPKEDVAETSKS